MKDRSDPDTTSDPVLSSWPSPCLRVPEDTLIVFGLRSLKSFSVACDQWSFTPPHTVWNPMRTEVSSNLVMYDPKSSHWLWGWLFLCTRHAATSSSMWESKRKGALRQDIHCKFRLIRVKDTSPFKASVRRRRDWVKRVSWWSLSPTSRGILVNSLHLLSLSFLQSFLWGVWNNDDNSNSNNNNDSKCLHSLTVGAQWWTQQLL